MLQDSSAVALELSRCSGQRSVALRERSSEESVCCTHHRHGLRRGNALVRFLPGGVERVALD